MNIPALMAFRRACGHRGRYIQHDPRFKSMFDALAAKPECSFTHNVAADWADEFGYPDACIRYRLMAWLMENPTKWYARLEVAEKLHELFNIPLEEFLSIWIAFGVPVDALNRAIQFNELFHVRVSMLTTGLQVLCYRLDDRVQESHDNRRRQRASHY